uniref:MADF domain-containing protein n=1 Tax=Vespula pensylvanica TaxID=30213 RepID=A0A834JTR9_VESPE|nr:hypothetical protein H0235_017059 [Vespula pensylvanica]
MTYTFLDLYQTEPILYNPTLDEYRDRDMRAAAAQRISEALNIDGFGPKEVILKFKNLRSSYCQELKKIADSQRSGRSTDEIYKPKVVWFTKMNSFIRPFVQQRETQSNVMLQRNNIETEINQEINAEQVITEDIANDKIFFHTSQLSKTLPVCNKPVEKRKVFFNKTESENKLPKKKKNMNVCEDSAFISHVLNKLQDISTRAEQIAEKKDSYDHFGKYIGSLLRTIGFPDAMKLQQQIITLIMNRMCAPTIQNQYSNTVPSTSCSEEGASEHIYSPSNEDIPEEYTDIHDITPQIINAIINEYNMGPKNTTNTCQQISLKMKNSNFIGIYQDIYKNTLNLDIKPNINTGERFYDKQLQKRNTLKHIVITDVYRIDAL